MNVQKTPILGNRIIKGIVLGLLFLVVCSTLWVYFSLGNLRHLSLYIPNVTGFPFGGKHYLVLLQNNTELRPTGGFISSYADVGFDFGLIPKIQIHDVYSLKGHKDEVKEEAPYPMGDLLASPNYLGHSFHDANWYPDLPLSSKDILHFYAQEFPDQQIDGVIALNYSFIEDLLGVVGQITIDGTTLTRDNLFATIEYTQNNIDKHNVEEIEGRKSILSLLAPKLIRHIILHPEKLHTISNTMYSSLEKKDISVYMADSMLQERFTTSGWTNVFPKPKGAQDIFAVVVANLGGMKSDRYIQRTFDKTIELSYQGETAEKTTNLITQRLHFEHPGTINPPLSNTFVGYIRSYVPKDAKFIQLMDGMDTYEEHGYMVVGKKIQINAGDSADIVFSYSLPEQYLGTSYTSDIYKQSGAEHTTQQITLRLPGDMRMQSTDFEIKENTAHITTSRPKDERISLKIQKDTTPPRVVHQEFIDYNRILLEFNEPILSYDCSNIENYSITDANTIVPSITNKPTVQEVQCKGRQAIIFTSGIRTQYGEHFSLDLRNLRDANNNIITTNPKRITVVQRFTDDAPKQ